MTLRFRVRPFALGAVALGASLFSSPAAAQRGRSVRPDSAGIRRDVNYLASDALAGRLAGTPGNDSAAAFIARRYAALGLRPLSAGYLQPFVARPVTKTMPPPQLRTQNVFALLRGRDARLRGQYVVVGAHFDHLGRSTDGALDPDDTTAVRKGADDNASGTAAVLELARLLSRNPPRRSVLFVNFSAEEEGLLGSRYFVDHMPVPLDSVVAMLNFDMVGRLRDDKLIVYGVKTATEFGPILDSANAATSLRITGNGDGYGPSDQTSFYEKDLPVLFFFTDLHDDYHRASDIAARINAGGEARVVALAAGVARRIADRPSRLTFVKSAAPPPSTQREGTNVYLGTIPDMAASDQAGLRITGVRAGSPAEKGGLQAGDVIVEFGDKPVKDLYTYSDALYSHQPGDEVSIVVLRIGQRVTLTVTLGKR